MRVLGGLPQRAFATGGGPCGVRAGFAGQRPILGRSPFVAPALLPALQRARREYTQVAPPHEMRGAVVKLSYR